MVDVLHYKMQDAFVILSHFLKGLISVLKIHFERVFFFLDNLCLVAVLCSSLYSCICISFIQNGEHERSVQCGKKGVRKF